MTVVAGLKEHDGAAVVLASDSLTAGEMLDGSGYFPIDNASVKSLRLNDSCAVGCAGDDSHCDWLFGNMFGLSAEEIAAGGVAKRLEREGVSRDDLSCAGAIKLVAEMMIHYREKSAQFSRRKLDVVLAGIDGGEPVVISWLARNDWARRSVNAVITLPKDPTADRKRQLCQIQSRCASATDRSIDIIRTCASWFPDVVNARVLLRSSASGFTAKVYAPSNAPGSG